MNKFYIVWGKRGEYDDEEDWIEKIFENKEQAEACVKYINLIHATRDEEYWVQEYDKCFCTEDYISKLEDVRDTFEWMYKCSLEEIVRCEVRN